ncbi:MAG: universal stress protein [Alkalispirochaeta sp.]
MFERGLVPVHLRERRSRVEAVVTELARLSIHHVRLLHVAGSSNRARRAAQKVEGMAREIADSADMSEELTISAQTVTGSAVSEIIETAVAQEVDVIAVPWKRKNWVQRSLLGSTSLDLIRLSPVPVLIQKPTLGRNPTVEEPLSVLYATDLRDADRTVFPLIERGALGAIDLTILTVGHRAPDPRAEARRIAAAESALEDLAARVRPVANSVRPVVETGASRNVIPAYLRRERFDVAVIGSGVSGAQPILGSTAEEVAYRSPSSVLMVPSPSEKGEDHA